MISLPGISNLLPSLSSLSLCTSLPRPPEKERSVPPSERVGGVRPTMKDFVDELTEVEQKVSEDLSDPHRPRGMTSSTATRELDELMANLSNFEPASSSSGGDVGRMEGGGAVARESGKTRSTAMDNLNSMLGSLDEVMTKRHGVNTTAKGERGGREERGREAGTVLNSERNSQSTVFKNIC